MKYVEIGVSGIKASVIGLGTLPMGGWNKGNKWGGIDEDKSIRTIHAALDSGINLIDTAPIYGMGKVEKIVGKAIKCKRDKVVIATKCGIVWHINSGMYIKDYEPIPVYRYLNPGSIEYELNESLKRLNTDYIDLYQTHWQDPTTPIEDTMEKLLDLKKKGKVRAIGVCNILSSSLEEIKRYKKSGKIDSDQEQYNLIERQLEKELLPWCNKNNISVIAYGPLLYGLLTGKITEDFKPGEYDYRAKIPLFSSENIKKIKLFLKKITPIADKYKASFSQIAISYILSQHGITHVLCGASNDKQIMENAKTSEISINNVDLIEIKKLLEEQLL